MKKMVSTPLAVTALAVAVSLFPRLDAADLRLTFADNQSRPLRDVETRLVSSAESPETETNGQYRKSDKAGRVAFESLEPGRYLVQAQKNSYTPLRLVVDLNEDTTRTQVLLKNSQFEDLEEQAAALGKEGRAQEAIEALEDLLRHYPEDELLHNRLAFQYAALGEAEKALAAAQRAAGGDAQFSATPAQIERILLRASAEQALHDRDFPTAIEKFEALTRADENDPAGFHGLALAYGHAGRFKEALASVDRAIELDPDNEALPQIRTVLEINSQAQ